MQKLGYTVGTFNPCLYYHENKKTKVYRHGDDFVLEGSRKQAKEFQKQLSEHLLVKHRGNLGLEKARGDVQEIRVLSRILRWVRPPYGKGQESIELEPVPRHAGILMQQCGLDGNSNSATTLGKASAGNGGGASGSG